jgi:hypothetical protein
MYKLKLGETKYPIFIFSQLFILVLTLSVFVFYFKFQPTIDYSICPKCDAHQYSKIYHYFKSKDTNFSVLFPFNSRILTPFLAARLPSDDIILNFKLINLFFTLASIYLLFLLWFQLKIPLHLIFFGLFWLLFHWLGIIRLNMLDPITVDVGVYFFEILLLWCLLYEKYFILSIITPFAIAQKEVFLALLVIFFAYQLFIFFIQKSKINLLPITGILILGICTKISLDTIFYATNSTGKNALFTVFFHLKQHVLDPLDFILWPFARALESWEYSLF